MFTDNQTIASWFAGSSAPAKADGRAFTTRGFSSIYQIMVCAGLRPRFPGSAAISWVPRALTAAADYLCNLAMDQKTSFYFDDLGYPTLEEGGLHTFPQRWCFS